MKTILISGTPGCGKSTFIAALKQHFENSSLSLRQINISELIQQQHLYERHDKKFDSYIIDEYKVCKFMKEHLKQITEDLCVLETHSVGTIPKGTPNLIVVLRCRTDVLYDRLVSRGYSKRKIDENIECEIMQIVLEEVQERFSGRSVLELDCNTMEELARNISIVTTEIGKLYP